MKQGSILPQLFNLLAKVPESLKRQIEKNKNNEGPNAKLARYSAQESAFGLQMF